jgi:hypothetical protein
MRCPSFNGFHDTEPGRRSDEGDGVDCAAVISAVAINDYQLPPSAITSAATALFERNRRRYYPNGVADEKVTR